MGGAEGSGLSLQTRPYSLKHRKHAELSAQWGQDLVLEELAATKVVSPATLLLFEILQVPLPCAPHLTRTVPAAARCWEVRGALL